MSSKQWGHGYHKGYSDAIKKQNGIVGLCFHSMLNGKINWQGYVVNKIDDEYYLVQLFSHLTGFPTIKKQVHKSDMSDWNFYDSDKDMRYFFYKQEGLNPEEEEKYLVNSSW